MTVRNPWSRHYQAVWGERAGDRRLPAWLRVASLAFGSHTANGHAQFKPGEIGLILGHVDSETGEIRPLNKGSVHRAIRTAVDYGWLLPESGTRCLVVPGHAVVGGLGNADDVCPQHRKGMRSAHTRGPNVGSQRTPSSHSAHTDNAVTSTNVVDLYESSHSSKSPDEPDPGKTRAHVAAGGAS